MAIYLVDITINRFLMKLFQRPIALKLCEHVKREFPLLTSQCFASEKNGNTRDMKFHVSNKHTNALTHKKTQTLTLYILVQIYNIYIITGELCT